MKPTFLRVGIPHNRARPPTSIRPPTEAGQATLISAVGSSLQGAEAATSHAMPLPSAFTTGDILLGICQTGAFTAHGVPDGWIRIGAQVGNAFSMAKRIVDGTEGNTATWTFGTTTESAVICWGVKNPGNADWSVKTPDAAAAGVVDGVNPINPPAVTPSHGAADYWIFPVMGFNAGSGMTPASGYTTVLYQRHVDPSDPGAYVASQKVAVVTSEDPGGFTLLGTLSGLGTYAQTIAVIADTSAELATGDHGHDHGDLTGLADDDHAQYSLVAGTRAFTGEVAGVTPTVDASLATKGYVDGVSGVTDHGSLTGLADTADHAYASLIDGTRAFTGVVSGVTPTAAAHLATKGYVDSGGGGHYEVIVSGSAPPVAVTNEAADDWLYGWVDD